MREKVGESRKDRKRKRKGKGRDRPSTNTNPLDTTTILSKLSKHVKIPGTDAGCAPAAADMLSR